MYKTFPLIHMTSKGLVVQLCKLCQLFQFRWCNWNSYKYHPQNRTILITEIDMPLPFVSCAMATGDKHNPSVCPLLIIDEGNDRLKL